VIKARHIPFFVRFFSWYSKYGLQRYFHRIDFLSDVDVSGSPVLLIGNHFSWWDGFIAYRLNDLMLRKKFHVMMLEEQLKGRMFLNKAGAYSIKRGSRSVIDSLSYTSSLLREKNNMAVIYPQGEITSVHRRPVVFEKGIDRILRDTPEELMILFYVALPDWFSEQKPSLMVRVTRYESSERSTVAMEKAFNAFMNDCITMQKPL
jgi:1-acyl-sn-glycerol-3-phosphate acyltransferase